MNYKETVDYLYSLLPSFQKSGGSAVNYKLEKIKAICKRLGSPQDAYKIIHVAGTNGKGSSSHYIASILQEANLKVGLYTSPHLKDFRERFKVNGKLAPEEFVIDFVGRNKDLIEEFKPSFFELTVAMSFTYFKEQGVDWAVVEVGLGGRLDSTNIVKPTICLITNIGFDHMEFLGNTLAEIAAEKAGIIKDNVPVIISEKQQETTDVFLKKGKIHKAPVIFAEDESSKTKNIVEKALKVNPLRGSYQKKNIKGVLALFYQINQLGILEITEGLQVQGVANIINNTVLKGRWQPIQKYPLTICDTGHNNEAFRYILDYLNTSKHTYNHLVLGFSRDKDYNYFIQNLPKNSTLYLATFNSNRSLNLDELNELGRSAKRNFKTFNSVNKALAFANLNANEDDFIFIGGSTYLVAELNNL